MNDSKTSNDSAKSKHKKKVSFSIFEVSTFDELAKLRKMREEELDSFVINKKKTNQYLNNLNQRNKILSLSNNDLISFDDNTNTNDNISRNFHVQKNVNIPKPIKRHIFPDDSNMISNIGLKNKIIRLNKKTLFSDDEEDIKSKEIFPSIPQFNSIEKNELINELNILKQNNSDFNNLSNFNKMNYYLQNNNNISANNINNIINENNKIDKSTNNIIHENNNNNKSINNINNIIQKNNNNSENNNINDKLVKENNENININNNIEVEENINNLNNMKMNAISLFNALGKIFNYSQTFKIFYIKEFFINIREYIDKKFELYIDYESSDPSYGEEMRKKKELISQKIYYKYFMEKIRKIVIKNKIYKEHKAKAEKYKAYLNYKYKAYAFNNLYSFGKKQKEWIKTIQIGFKKKLVWDCFDSLKLYANYKKIKNYLRTKKKKKIFDVLKNNKQLSLKLLKNGKKLNLIFEFRHFFNNCRKKILSKKGKEINEKLIKEFRNQNLMKNIFNLIKINCQNKKAKRNRFDNIVMKNKINNEFINIKITRKETVKFNNGNTLLRIQDKINII